MDEPITGATPEQIEAAAVRMLNDAQTGDPGRARPGFGWRDVTEDVREFYRSEARYFARFFFPEDE